MKIRIDKTEIDTLDDGSQEALKNAYMQKIRPYCLCRPNGVAMYIAKVNNSYILKRMPNSGGNHSPDCMSYEPPHELSGLGEVLGQAIQENEDNGSVSLKLDFSLTKRGGRNAPVPTGKEHDSVKTDGKKLTLRGLLHYLYEQGKLNYYVPTNKMPNWVHVRKQLLSASTDKSAKQQELIKTIYIPETFNLDYKREITARRNKQLAPLSNSAPGSQQLMIVIAEVKSIEKARFDYKIIAKHCPDYHFFLNEDIHKRINKRFQAELELWDMLGDRSHLMFIATFMQSATGMAIIQDISLMLVNKHWIPFESQYEYQVIEEMIVQERQFIKGLRYNLPTSKPLATLVAVDTIPKPTAMYIIPPFEGDTYRQSIDQMIDQSDYASWVWDVENPLPDLPGNQITEVVQD